MIDYSKLPNPEIDKLTAEMMRFRVNIGGKYRVPTYYCDDKSICLVSYWKPTDPNSAQAELILFPKFSDGFSIEVNFIHGVNCIVKICQWDNCNWVELVRVKGKYDQINRTKCIACLMAMDKMRERKK